MKKFTIAILATVFALMNVNSVFGQTGTQTDEIKVNAILADYLSISIDETGDNITETTFTFDESSDYEGGITGGNTNTFNVNASCPWELTMTCPEKFTPANVDAANTTLACGNLAFKLSTVGDANAAGNNLAHKTYTALSTSETVIQPTSQSVNNTGSVVDNSFKIDWEMGTANDNQDPLMEQLQAGTLLPDTYSLLVTFTVAKKTY